MLYIVVIMLLQHYVVVVCCCVFANQNPGKNKQMFTFTIQLLSGMQRWTLKVGGGGDKNRKGVEVPLQGVNRFR